MGIQKQSVKQTERFYILGLIFCDDFSCCESLSYCRHCWIKVQASCCYDLLIPTGKKTFQTYTSGYLFNGYIFSITVEYSFNNNLLNVQCEELPVLKLSFYHELSVSLPIACTQPKQTFNNGMQKHMKSITEGLSTVFSGSKINSLDGKD